MIREKLFVVLTAMLFLFSCFFCQTMSAQPKRPIVPSDCVTVRYLFFDNTGQQSIRLNPQGKRVAYLVKSPNLALNRNDIELYVKDLPSKDEPRLLLSSPDMSGLQWLGDGRHALVLAHEGGHVSVVQVDTETGERRTIITGQDDIKEFSVDASGDVIVFATEEVNRQQAELDQRTEDEAARGYRIAFQAPATAVFYRRRVFVTRRNGDSEWTLPAPVSFQSPFTKQTLNAVAYIATLHLSLSPNGKLLLISYVDGGDQLPETWEANPYVQSLRQSGFPGVIPTLLVDLTSGQSRIAIESPWSANTPLWSNDGRSFIVSTESPVGSNWAEDDKANHRIGAEGAHLFSVDTATGQINLVALRAADIGKQPLSWNSDGDLILRTAATTITRLTFTNGKWKEVSSFQIPLVDYYRFAELSSDGSSVVGDYQNAATPPQMFFFRSGSKSVETIVRLNPQFDNLSLAAMQKIDWTTSTGYNVQGYLFMPPGFVKGVRYPLVIQTKSDEGQFVCDTGQNHYPSFAPQPIANAGIMYLARTVPPEWTQKDEEDHYPRGYPGGIGEAAFQTDVWDSAIKSLDHLGLVDPAKVGIIGFSRTGWYTGFALTHASTHYRAATLADNVEYSVSEYWYLHSAAIIQGWDVMYGGPPSGGSLENWLKFSVSFSIDKIHTPVLMEAMGYGVAFDNAKAPPLNLAARWDLFTGLNSLSKPVELYYYPNEGHQPDHPRARLATLQRNLDWYRFWLQGYERPNPDDSGQYRRWEHLRDLQDADDRTATHHSVIAPKPN